MNTPRAKIGKVGILAALVLCAVVLFNPVTSYAATITGGSGFTGEGANPKYGKTWVASITCRSNSGSSTTIGGAGSPWAVLGAVNAAIDQRGLGIAKAAFPLVRSDGGTGGGNRWDNNGTIHQPTVQAVCQILGYDTYVSSTCHDEERSNNYPGGKCNFHSPGNNNLSRFSGTLVFPTPTPSPTATPTPAPTPTATPIPQCQNRLDDDGDGLIDMADPGCSNPNDNNEGDGTSQCQDGIDNDGDGAADFPNDFSCSSRQDNDETLPKAQCQDGLDNDSDGLIDLTDPGCSNRQDNDESHTAAATPTPTPTPTPSATPTPTPEPGEAAFTVTKSDGQDIVRPGHSLTYTIKIKNTGDREISDLELLDTVPNHLSITKVTPAALTRSGQVVKWAGIHLNEGETKEFTITATVKSTTPDNTVLKNTVRVESDDFDVKEAATDSTTVKKIKVVVVSGPAIAGATHVPVTAKTGATSVLGALASMIAGGGLMVARKRLS